MNELSMDVIIESSWGGALHRLNGVMEEHRVDAGDGVLLYTQVFRQAEMHKGPVVLIRDPYFPALLDDGERRRYWEFIRGTRYAEWTAAGFILVFQHCRGTGLSEGKCIPYANERADGLALLEWVRRQPFYDGDIYLMGTSYLSSVHYSWLNAAGDDIKAAVLPVQDCSRYGIIYHNGFYKVGLHGSWALSMYTKNNVLPRLYTEETFRTMPLTDVPKAAFGTDDDVAPLLVEEMKHPSKDDPFWQSVDGGSDYLHCLEKVKFPILLATSFYDIYTQGVLDMWESLPPAVKAKSSLLVTPYDHDCSCRYGHLFDLEFPYGRVDEVWPHFKQSWCTAMREGRQPDFVKPGMVTWYIQGEERWKSAPRLDDGPTTMNFFLGEKLLAKEPQKGTAFQIVYNPYDPTPFPGGCCETFGGQRKQPAANFRPDVHSFVSAPLESTISMQGRAEVTLQVSSDCEDTSFYVRLDRVLKDGTVLCLRDDIVSLRSQHPGYRPGERVQLRFGFTANALTLAPGEALRLDVSCSAWPHYVPHRNTLENYWEARTARIAHNVLYSEGSSLTLHLV